MQFKLHLKNNSTSDSKVKRCQFWEPGLVSYKDQKVGVALLKKETMEKMLPSFIGCPVTIGHVEGNAEQIRASGRAVGTITGASWNPQTGWFDAEFTVDTEDAEQKASDPEWSVSCGFDSDDRGPGGEWHAIRYTFEIVDGHFTHLAICPAEKVRYEDSVIFQNQKCFINSKEATVEPYCDACDRVKSQCVCGKENGLGDALQKTADKEKERREKEVARMKIVTEEAHKDNSSECSLCGLPIATPGEHNPEVARCSGHTEAERAKAKQNSVKMHIVRA